MEKEEELKNSELLHNEGEGIEGDEMEGEGMDVQDMEGEGYDNEEFENDDDQYVQQNPLQPNMNQYQPQQQTGIQFYPSQNPMVPGGYGGALRPVSANVLKGSGKRRLGNKQQNKDFDIRTRPKNFVKDKEGLYDDTIKLK